MSWVTSLGLVCLTASATSASVSTTGEDPSLRARRSALSESRPQLMTSRIGRPIACASTRCGANAVASLEPQRLKPARHELFPDFRKAEEAQKTAMDQAVQDFISRQKAEGKAPQYIDSEPLQEEWLARIPRPPLKSLIDHIDHIGKVAGIDHVGLGSDFDGVSGALPAEIDSAADLPKITQSLLDRGYDDNDIRKILGGNLLRVMNDVERVSHELQAAQKRKE